MRHNREYGEKKDAFGFSDSKRQQENLMLRVTYNSC